MGEFLQSIMQLKNFNTPEKIRDSVSQVVITR